MNATHRKKTDLHQEVKKKNKNMQLLSISTQSQHAQGSRNVHGQKRGGGVEISDNSKYLAGMRSWVSSQHISKQINILSNPTKTAVAAAAAAAES